MPRQTLIFLSPCFCGGADNKSAPAELRVPSVRGQLRYWARVLFHDPCNGAAAAFEEHQLFGGIRGRNLGFRHPEHHEEPLDAVASRFVVRLRCRTATPVKDYFLVCPHDPAKRGRSGYAPDTEFDLDWSEFTTVGGSSETEFRRVLKAWVLLGGLGARSTRAAGSVWRAGWKPLEDEFNREVASLWPNQTLPAFLKVRVLRRPAQDEVPPALRNLPDQEMLRAIATDLLELRMNYGGVFGFAFRDQDGGHRKTSPLRLKLGRFTAADGEENRLIAIWDNRNTRGGQLKEAIARQAHTKLIGKLLNAAFFP